MVKLVGFSQRRFISSIWLILELERVFMKLLQTECELVVRSWWGVELCNDGVNYKLLGDIFPFGVEL